jgi:hypothetical protein
LTPARRRRPLLACALGLTLLGGPGCDRGDGEAPATTANQPDEATARDGRPAVPALDPAALAGRYAGDRLALALEASPEGRLSGTLAVGRRAPFPATAAVVGTRFVGSFRAKGAAYPFAGWPTDDGVVLELDGRTYVLRPAAATRPASEAPPSAIAPEASPAPASGPALAGPPGSGRAPLAGRYLGSVNGLPAELTLSLVGSEAHGLLSDASGYRYLIQAERDGAGAAGHLVDPQSGSKLPVRLRPAGTDRLEVVLDAEEGRARVVAFERSDAPLPQGTHGRDPALLGTWVGPPLDPRGARPTLRFQADGTYAEGQSRAASHGVQGRTATAAGRSGRWRSQDGLLELSPASADAWRARGSYVVSSNGRLLLTPPSGELEEWERPD